MTMKKTTKTENSLLPQRLAELRKEASDSRERVSGYSDERRASLETHARDLIQNASTHPKVRCP